MSCLFLYERSGCVRKKGYAVWVWQRGTQVVWTILAFIKEVNWTFMIYLLLGVVLVCDICNSKGLHWTQLINAINQTFDIINATKSYSYIISHFDNIKSCYVVLLTTISETPFVKLRCWSDATKNTKVYTSGEGEYNGHLRVIISNGSRRSQHYSSVYFQAPTFFPLTVDFLLSALCFFFLFFFSFISFISFFLFFFWLQRAQSATSRNTGP